MVSDDRGLGGQPWSRPTIGSGTARRPPSWSGAVLGVKILAALLSAAIVVGSGIAWTIYRDFANNVTVIDFASPDGPDIDGEDLNILIVGDDSRAGATEQELAELGTTDDGAAGERTDTIMVMHVPADGEAASVMSFPRDSWVDIPGHGYGKINSAFSYGKADAGGDDAGGATLLGEVIHNLTGLRIDHFIKIGMLGFLRVSKAIDGVDLCLNNKMGLEEDSDAEHPDGYTGIDLQQGWNYNVQGHQAVAFVRQRHGLPNDLARVKRQQYFLAAAFRKIESKGVLLNPFKLSDLVSAVSSSLTVDEGLRGTKLLSLATQMSALTAGNLTFVTAPNNPDAYIDGQSVVLLDEDALRDEIARFIGQSDAYTEAAPADPSTVSVRVINNTDGNQAGDAAIAALTALGFRATAVASPDVSATTSIRYPDGLEAQAKALAAAVPAAAVIATGDVDAVTLVLGNDGATVVAPGGGGAPPPDPGPTSGAPSDPGADVMSADDADCID